jgi:hypothetical protein
MGKKWSAKNTKKHAKTANFQIPKNPNLNTKNKDLAMSVKTRTKRDAKEPTYKRAAHYENLCPLSLIGLARLNVMHNLVRDGEMDCVGSRNGEIMYLQFNIYIKSA